MVLNSLVYYIVWVQQKKQLIQSQNVPVVNKHCYGSGKIWIYTLYIDIVSKS